MLKFFEGACPQTPLENVDCWYSQLLYSDLLATSFFIETPIVQIQFSDNFAYLVFDESDTNQHHVHVAQETL